MLIYVVGGPGGSGLAVADDYLSAYDAKLTENMDIVFFDQRGIGPDHGLACPKAQAIFDTAETSIKQPEAAIAIAKAYATDCPAELKSRDLLPYVDTEQAIRDVELFRQAIGSPQIWIYGESYGTQFAQQYATAFPTSVKGVVVDGVVDLNLDFDGYYTSYVLAAERILARVLADCAVTPGCREDMRGDATSAYDGIAALTSIGPIEVDFPLADGTITKRKLTAGMLEADAFYALYGPDDRATFLRALAAGSRGDLLPLLRLAYYNLEIDPQTLDRRARSHLVRRRLLRRHLQRLWRGHGRRRRDGAADHREGESLRTPRAAAAELLLCRAAGLRLLAEARPERAAEALCRRRVPDADSQRRHRSDHADHHVPGCHGQCAECLSGHHDGRAPCDLGPGTALPG